MGRTIKDRTFIKCTYIVGMDAYSIQGEKPYPEVYIDEAEGFIYRKYAYMSKTEVVYERKRLCDA